MSLDFAPTAGKDRATIPIHTICHTNNFINTRRTPTPTLLGKVYTRALIVLGFPPPLTKERSSVGLAQAPHRAASRWSPFQIHYSNGAGCIFRFMLDVIFSVTHNCTMTIHGQCTPPSYANKAVLFCVHAVWVFLFPKKIWWWCVSTSPEFGTVDLPFESCCPCTYPTFTILQCCLNLDVSLTCSFYAVCMWSRSLLCFVCTYDPDWPCKPNLWQMNVVESCRLLCTCALCAPNFEWQ